MMGEPKSTGKGKAKGKATKEPEPKKQTTLLGFFTKSPAAAPSRQKTPEQAETPSSKRRRVVENDHETLQPKLHEQIPCAREGEGPSEKCVMEEHHADPFIPANENVEDDDDEEPVLLAPKRRRVLQNRVIVEEADEVSEKSPITPRANEKASQSSSFQFGITQPNPTDTHSISTVTLRRAEKFRFRSKEERLATEEEKESENGDDDDSARKKQAVRERFAKRFEDPSAHDFARRRAALLDDANKDESAPTPLQHGKYGRDQKQSPDLLEPGSFAFALAPNTKKPTYTPLEKQVIEIKKQNKGVLLVVEVGYKFRFFGEDAFIASKELNIACFLDRTGHFYNASIPVHRLMIHARRLVQAGHKVGIVRQMETAALKAAGDNKSQPFVRKLTNLYTKGTFVDEMSDGNIEGSSLSSYLLCIYEEPKGGGIDDKVNMGIVAVQLSTGDIIYDHFEDSHLRAELETRIMHIEPCELLVPPISTEGVSKATSVAGLTTPTEKVVNYLSRQGYGSASSLGDTVRVERPENTFLSAKESFTCVSDFYAKGVTEDDNLDMEDRKKNADLFAEVLRFPQTVIVCLAALIRHLEAFGLQHVLHLTKFFTQFSSRAHMLLNGNTLSNLEIYRNQTEFTEKGSLLWTLDHTNTAFGKRMLKSWVGRPLVNIKELNRRVDAVEELLACLNANNPHVKKLLGLLKGLPDLEKNLCRIHYGKCSTSELWQVLSSFLTIAEAFPSERRPCDEDGDDDMERGTDSYGFKSPLLSSILAFLPTVRDDVLAFRLALNEKAAESGDKLNLFVENDERFEEIRNCKEVIAGVEEGMQDYLRDLRKELKRPSLEFTSVSGTDYLIELKHKDATHIPRSWIKVSSTKAVGRYHSQFIIEKIKTLQQCKERLSMACDRAYTAFLREISEKYETLRDLVRRLAGMDCLLSLAAVARQPGYVKPVFIDDVKILVKAGRHPMVERVLPEPFVPNDIHLDSASQRTMIVTGPNMGGKSSYIRTVALISIMGQIGSYVPAESATLGMLDAVYTRMGAFDNMLKGESTFMVELKETSDIMKQATPRSLVILDELGRGTSTYDGVAIAHAVLQHFVTEIKSLTLFVTHYPSLASVAEEHPDHVGNYHMGFLTCDNEDESAPAGRGENGITFLYQLTSGAAQRSYGINVARLAHLPEAIIRRASVKGAELEASVDRKHRKKMLRDGVQILKALDRSQVDGENDKILLEVVDKARRLKWRN